MMFSLRGRAEWRVILLAIACSVVVSAYAEPARAQGLFQTIFGFFAPQSPPATVTRPDDPRSNPFDQQPSYSPMPSRGAGYRTVCVRMCDGYYFPISASSSRDQFYRDADRCRSRCGGDVRLFHMPASSHRIEDAYDQTGLAYKRMKTAFFYRKRLVEGCGCRPPPWSASERARHEMYAAAEAGTDLNRVALARSEPAAGSSVDSDAESRSREVPTMLEAPEPPPILADRAEVIRKRPTIDLGLAASDFA